MTGLPAVRVTQGDEELLDPDWQYLQDHGLNLTTLELHFPLGADWHTLRECAPHGVTAQPRRGRGCVHAAARRG
jgi:hypothetical protein